jgi:hypothetical protein
LDEYEKLTPNDIREHFQNEGMSDEEANAIINSIYELSLLTLKIIENENK